MRRTFFALLLLGTLDLAAAVTGWVVDDDGKPLPGVRVRAVALESQEAQFARLASASPEPTPLGETKTNDAGAFTVDTKRSPVVTLLIDAPGRAWIAEDVLDGEDAGAFQLRAAAMKKGRVTAGGKPVANAQVILNNAFLARTNDAGEYTAPDPEGWLFRITVLHPDYAMAEKVRLREWPTLDIALNGGIAARGRVVDPAGQPVANATLRNGYWPIGKSGEDGSFTIAHLDPAVTVLHAREGTRTGSAKPNADVVLHPAATVGGTLRSSKDDTPVAGARVTLRGDAASGFAATAITDAKGAFVIDGAPAGVFSLSTTHPAFSMASANDVRTTAARRTERALAATPLARISGIVVDEQKKPVSGARVGFLGAGGPVTTTAPDGTFSRRVYVFDRGAMIEVTKASYASASHGPVQAEPGEARGGVRIVLQRGTKFEFRLVDREGVAIAGEPILIMRRAELTQRGIMAAVRCAGSADPASCRSDAEGKVAVHVVEGSYDVRAGGLTTVEKHVVSTLGASESPLVIELERGATIEGRLVWSDGTPVTSPASVTAGEGRGVGAVQVIDGAFTIRNAPRGKIMLTAQTGPPSFFRGEPVEVEAPSSGVVLRLPRPGRIEGRVIERDTQRAITQFSVATEPRGGTRRGLPAKAFTADDGRFVVEDVAPGALDVVVTAPGYVLSTTGAVEIAEGKATTLEVALERAGTIAGRVTSGGRPVPGASLSVAEARRMRSASGKQTDANGEYVLDTVPAGSHEVTISKSGYLSKTISVNVAVGKESRGDVELSRGRELHGRVVDGSGRGVAGADVSVRAAARSPIGFGEGRTTDAEGNFKLDGLADELVTVVARRTGFADGIVDVNPATAMNVTITLERGGTLTGRVVGLPPGETVEVYATSFTATRPGSTARTTPDASGNFTISGVSDGEVTVSAQQLRSPRRRVASQVKVIAGNGPFVELDFSAGIAVRGRVTRGGQVVGRGSVHFTPVDLRDSNRGTGGEIAVNGTYEARVPAPGQYTVMVSLWDAGISAPQSGKIDVRGDMQHDIDIRGAAVRIRVVDAATGAPLPDTRVMLSGAEGRGGNDRMTDSAGRVVFDFVADGSYLARASRAGYFSDPRDVIVQHGAAADVEIALGRGEEVQVRLVDAATGVPVDGYTVILDAAGKIVADRPAMSDPGGAQRFWLRPGNYTIRVVGRDYAPSVTPLIVPGTPVVQIEMQKVKRD